MYGENQPESEPWITTTIGWNKLLLHMAVFFSLCTQTVVSCYCELQKSFCIHLQRYFRVCFQIVGHERHCGNGSGYSYFHPLYN